MEKPSKLTTKKLIMIIAAVVVLCGLALGALVFSRNNIKEVASKENYGYVNPDETKAETDAGFVIDGVLDEEQYQKNNWLYLSNKEGGANVDIAMTSYYGEKGMYFVYDVTEGNPIYVNTDRASYLNSCIEMYLAPSTVTALNGNSLFEIDLLPTGDMTFKKSNGKGGYVNVATTDDMMAVLGATTKGGEVNSEECYGYCLELFIPWEYMDKFDLNSDAMKDSFVYVDPAHITSFNFAGTDTNVDRYWYYFAQQHGAGFSDVYQYFRFDENGVQGSVPVELQAGEHYTIEGGETVIPGMKTNITITPEAGYALNSILVNGEEYIKKVNFNEDGSVTLNIRGVKEGLKVSALAVLTTEGNKTLSGTVVANKLGGGSLKDVSASYAGPTGEKPLELDSKGKFTLTDLKQGYYTITIEKEGYEKLVRSIYLNRDMEVELSLEYQTLAVTKGSCWILDDQNDGVLHKFGGSGNLLSNDKYNKFTVEANFKYNTDLPKEADTDAFTQQRQGIRIVFSNEKAWHIDVMNENGKYIVQYAKHSGDNSVFGWKGIHEMTEEEVAKFTSENGIKLSVQRDGKYANVYLDGKLIAVEVLDDTFAKLSAQVGFEFWVANREIMDIPYNITTSTSVNLKSTLFKTAGGFDVSGQYDGLVTMSEGGRGNLEFIKKYANMDLTLKVRDYQNSTDKEGTYPRTDVLFVFENGAHISFGITSDENGAWIQSMNQSANEVDGKATQYIYKRWTSWGSLTEEEFAQYKDGGVDFRVVRYGTEVTLYIGDRMVAVADLTNNDSGVTADMPATVTIRHYDDAGVEVEMPFTVTEKLDTVTITSVESELGKAATQKQNYVIGDTVVLSGAGKDGYYMTGLKVNGKDVTLNWDGTYSFTVTEKEYKVEGTFAKRVFNDSKEWNLLKQNEGVISVPVTHDGDSNWVDFYDKYENIDLTLTARDYIGKETAVRTVVRFTFENEQTASFSIAYADGEYKIQSMGDTLYGWKKHHALTEEQIAAFQSKDGIDFRIVRIGTEVSLYLDGTPVAICDLMKTSKGVDTGIKADMPATVSVRHYGNVGYAAEIPFTVTDKIDLVTITSVEGKLGTVATNKQNYFVGDTVVLSGAGKDGYYMTGLKVNDKDVTLNWDGTYTFTATEKEYTAEGTFDKEVFVANKNWNLLEQNKGVVALPNGGNGGALQFVDKYTDIDLTVKATDYADKDNKGARTDILFVFENEAHVSFGVTRVDNKDGSKSYVIQSLNQSANDDKQIYNRYAWHGDLTAEEVEQYLDEGIDLRLIRKGEEVYIFVGDRLVNVADLTNNDRGVTADTEATVSIRHYDDAGVEVVIPFEVTDELDDVIKGKVTYPKGGKEQTIIGNYVENVDVTLTANDYDDPADKASRNEVYFVFENGAHVSFGITGVAQNDGSYNYIVQSLKQDDGNEIYSGWKHWGDLTEAEAEKYLSQGIDLRVVRVGTEVSLYVDGRFVAAADLTNNNSGVTADMEAAVYIRHYDDADVKVDIPFTLTEKLDLVEVILEDDEHGELSTNKQNYIAGDTVIVTGETDDYYLTGLTKNDEKVDLHWNGSYSVEVEKGDSLTFKGTFAKRVFVYNSGWNLLKQNEGVISLPSDHGAQSVWAEFYKKYTDIDLTVTAKDYIANDTEEVKTVVKFTFENGETVSLRIGYMDGHYKVQSMGDTIFEWSQHGTDLSEEDVAAYGKDGLEFRIVRSGTDIFIYAGNKRICNALDITKHKDGSETGIDGNMSATVAIRQDGNLGNEVVIPFTVTDKVPESVIINTAEGIANGTFRTEFNKYLLNDEVSIVPTGATGYYYDSLVVKADETKVDTVIDETKMLPTFKATETQYTVTGTFAPAVVKNGGTGYWDLHLQNVGYLALTNRTGDSAWLDSYEAAYRGVSVKVQDKVGRTNLFRMQIYLKFANNQEFRIRLHDTDGNDQNYKIQTMDGSLNNPTWKNVYTLNEETEAPKLLGEGIEFKVVIVAETAKIYLDDTNVYDIDLSKDKNGNASNIGSEPVSVTFRYYGNTGHDVLIPFDLIEAEDAKINITNNPSDGGKVEVVTKNNYVDGLVTIKPVAEAGYGCTSLKVNGEDVLSKLNADGTYTFTAGEENDVVATFKRKVTININVPTDPAYGTVTTEKATYYVGDEVKLIVDVADGYNCKDLVVKQNGNEVLSEKVIFADGNYSFTADKFNYTVEAEFVPKIFVESAEWDLTSQYEGVISIPDSDGDSGYIDTASNTYRDVRLQLRDYTENSTDYKAMIYYQFANKDEFSVAVTTADTKDLGTYKVQIQWRNTIVGNYSASTNLTDEQVKKITSEDGIEFRVAIVGSCAQIYLDGSHVMEVDLSKYTSGSKQGQETGIANVSAKITLRVYGNKEHDVEIPYILGGEPEAVTVNIPSEIANGTITKDKTSYIVGEKVTLTVAGKNNYYYNSLKIKDVKNNTEEDVMVDNDGTYTFTATEKEYDINGSFAKSIFKIDNNYGTLKYWNLMNQHKGRIVHQNNEKGNVYINFEGSYAESDVTVIVKDHEDAGEAGYRTAIGYYNSSNRDRGYSIVKDITDDGAEYWISYAHAAVNEDEGYTSRIYQLSSEETRLIEGEKGLELRVVRKGTTVYIYLDGTLRHTTSLYNYNATDTTSVWIKHFDDKGGLVEIPFTFSGTAPEEVNITTSTDGNGTISLDKDSYIVGEKVTVTVTGDDGYYYNSLKIKDLVNNTEEDVMVDNDGTYTFTATSEQYEIAATFAPSIFKTDRLQHWNLTNQYKGWITLRDDTTNSPGGADFKEQYKNSDVSILVKKVVEEDDIKSNEDRTEIGYWLSGSWSVGFSIVNNKGAYRVQGTNTAIYKWKEYGSLTTEEVQKITDGEGVELRVVREGADANIYVDGRLITKTPVDLTNGGNAVGFTADTKTTIYIRRYDDQNVSVDIPFTISDKLPEKVTIDIADIVNGTVTTDKQTDDTIADKSYIVGEKVVLTPTPAEGYEFVSLSVDGEEVKLASDGTYTFTATKTNYEVSATFVEDAPFVALATLSDDEINNAGMFYQNTVKTPYLADPFVLDNTNEAEGGDGYYYLYGTDFRAGEYGIKCYRSTDLMNWEDTGFIFEHAKMSEEARKVIHGDIWAPEVVYDADTELYYMFFSATPVEDANVTTGNGVEEGTANQVLFAATSKYPDKDFELVNFKDEASCGQGNKHAYNEQSGIKGNDGDYLNAYPHYYAKYLMFDPQEYRIFSEGSGLNSRAKGYGGYVSAIDPHPYVDADGTKYLFWVDSKGSDRICGIKMKNWLQPDWDNVEVIAYHGYYTVQDWIDNNGKLLEDTLESLKPVPYEKVTTINEGPTITKHGDNYYLTFSVNSYADNSYQVIQAVSKNGILGDYRKLTADEGAILLAGNDTVTGTGHHSFVTVGEQTYIVYHRHTETTMGSNRNHAIDEVEWITIEDKDGNEMDVMYVNGPTTTVQPAIGRYTNIAKIANTIGSDTVSYLNDGLISIQGAEETSVGEKTTFTFSFDSAQAVSGIMIYNSKSAETSFDNISKIELICQDTDGTVVRYVEGLTVPSADAGKPGAAAYAMFDTLNVKYIRITVDVPEGQESVDISEVKILSPKE